MTELESTTIDKVVETSEFDSAPTVTIEKNDLESNSTNDIIKSQSEINSQNQIVSATVSILSKQNHNLFHTLEGLKLENQSALYLINDLDQENRNLREELKDRKTLKKECSRILAKNRKLLDKVTSQKQTIRKYKKGNKNQNQNQMNSDDPEQQMQQQGQGQQHDDEEDEEEEEDDNFSDTEDANQYADDSSEEDSDSSVMLIGSDLDVSMSMSMSPNSAIVENSGNKQSQDNSESNTIQKDNSKFQDTNSPESLSIIDRLKREILELRDELEAANDEIQVERNEKEKWMNKGSGDDVKDDDSKKNDADQSSSDRDTNTEKGKEFQSASTSDHTDKNAKFVQNNDSKPDTDLDNPTESSDIPLSQQIDSLKQQLSQKTQLVQEKDLLLDELETEVDRITEELPKVEEQNQKLQREILDKMEIESQLRKRVAELEQEVIGDGVVRVTGYVSQNKENEDKDEDDGTTATEDTEIQGQQEGNEDVNRTNVDSTGGPQDASKSKDNNDNDSDNSDENDDDEEDIKVTLEDLNLARIKVEELEKENHELRLQSEELTLMAEDLTTKLEAMTLKNDELILVNDKTIERNGELTNSNQELANTNQELSQKIEEITSIIQKLTEDNDQLKTENQDLVNENMDLKTKVVNTSIATDTEQDIIATVNTESQVDQDGHAVVPATLSSLVYNGDVSDYDEDQLDSNDDDDPSKTDIELISNRLDVVTRRLEQALIQKLAGYYVEFSGKESQAQNADSDEVESEQDLMLQRLAHATSWLEEVVYAPEPDIQNSSNTVLDTRKTTVTDSVQVAIQTEGPDTTATGIQASQDTAAIAVQTINMDNINDPSDSTEEMIVENNNGIQNQSNLIGRFDSNNRLNSEGPGAKDNIVDESDPNLSPPTQTVDVELINKNLNPNLNSNDNITHGQTEISNLLAVQYSELQDKYSSLKRKYKNSLKQTIKHESALEGKLEILLRNEAIASSLKSLNHCQNENDNNLDKTGATDLEMQNSQSESELEDLKRRHNVLQESYGNLMLNHSNEIIQLRRQLAMHLANTNRGSQNLNSDVQMLDV